MIFQFLFLSIIGLGLVQADPVNVHVRVICDSSEDNVTLGTYCGTVTIFEADGVSSHDILGTEDFCTDQHNKTFEYQFSPETDYSPSYEIKYTLTHNCTIDGLIRCIAPRESQDVSVFGETHVNFTVEAYDIGEARTCLDPNHKNKSWWNTIFG